MSEGRIYNFSAGPSMMPLPVLEKAAAEMTNYGGSGMSVMEMSHRSKVYDGIIKETEAALRRVLSTVRRTFCAASIISRTTTAFCLCRAAQPCSSLRFRSTSW